MARLRRSHHFWALVAVAAGLCGALCVSFADAVVAKPKNGSSLVANQSGGGGGGPAQRPLLPDTLETSQTRVNQVQQQDNDGPRPHNKGSANRVSGKDYDGVGSYPVQNTYGPPRDYYYDERPDYYRPHQIVSDGHHYQQNGPPPLPPLSEVIYHQHSPGEHHQYNMQPVEANHNRPGELNIQPLLWPLAGITLLGVLSALVKAPLLLHLGTVGRRRRRRRRSLTTGRPPHGDSITAETIGLLLDKFNSKKNRFNAKACLVCDVVSSIYNEKSACVERSVCEVMSPRNESEGTEMDKRLLTSMIAQVIGNDQIPKEFKKRLEAAERSSRSGGNCERLYPCSIDDDNAGVTPETMSK